MTVEELLQRYSAGERNFSGVNLSRADLGGRVLSDIILDNADLTSVNLAGAELLRNDNHIVRITITNPVL